MTEVPPLVYSSDEDFEMIPKPKSLSSEIPEDNIRLANMNRSLDRVTKNMKEMRGELDSQRDTILNQEKKVSDQQHRLVDVEKKLAAETEKVKLKTGLLNDCVKTIKKDRAEKAELEKRLSGLLENLNKQKEITSSLREDIEKRDKSRIVTEREMWTRERRINELMHTMDKQTDEIGRKNNEMARLREILNPWRNSRFSFLSRGTTPPP